MPVLLGAQQIARPADFEVPERQTEARAELRELLDHAEPLLSRVVDPAVGGDQQVGVRLLALPAHAPPQLVELGEAEAVRPVQDDGVGGRDVEARLDDGRRDQHVGLAADEAQHDVLQVLFPHLAVGHHHAGPRDQPLDERRHGGQGLDPVVDEEDLAAAGQLALEGLADQLPAEGGHHRFDREPIQRRRFDDRQIPDPRQGHIERPGDRGGRQGQDIHGLSDLLDPLLVRHAEAVLLIHDEEPQVPEGNVPGEQAVGPDHHVHRALAEPRHHGLLLLRRAEAGEQLHPERERRKPLGEGPPVLLGQDRRRRQEGDLPAVHGGLERGPEGDLSLAVADVPRDQAIHGTGLLHVGLDLLDGAELMGRLLEAERRLELPLPGRVGAEHVAVQDRARRVEPEQLLGHLAERRPH